MDTRPANVARVALVAAALALAACGRGRATATDTAAGTLADTTTRLAPPVGSEHATMDSAVAKGNERIDSLKRHGETPASGIAKGIQPAAHASKNDSSTRAHKLHVKPTNVP
jgi:ABC-type glycerol-3-phosphate transport system substrate-binding protein